MVFFGLPARVSKSTLIVAAAVLVGLALGFWLVPRAPRADEELPNLPTVRLLGEALALDEAASNDALARVRRYAAGSLVLVLPDGKRREYYIGRLGGEI